MFAAALLLVVKTLQQHQMLFYSDSDNYYADGIQIYDNSNGILKDNEVFVESQLLHMVFTQVIGVTVNNITYTNTQVVGKLQLHLW